MLTLVFVLSSITMITSLQPALAQNVGSDIRTVYGWIGESVTLTCSGDVHNGYPILWFSNNRGIYLSTDNNVFDNVLKPLKDRLSAECQRGPYDMCRLTINPVNGYDSGTYRCLYYNKGSSTHDAVENAVQLIAGQPPSDDSPICETFKNAFDGSYTLINSYAIGDEIHLRCTVRESSINPSLDWSRNKYTTTTPLADISKRKTLSHEWILTHNDVGAVFTCSMTHPGLSEIRTCSITPLPVPRPTTTKSTTQPEAQSPTSRPTSRLVSDISESIIFITANKNKADNPRIDSHTSFVLPLILAMILLLFATVVIVLAILLVKRRKKHNVNPSKPNHDLSYDRDCSATAEYAVVNAPDSVENANKLKVAKRNQQESTVPSEHSSNGTKDITDVEEACPLYAKPDKRKKTNNVTVEVNDCDTSITASYAACNVPDFVDRANKQKDKNDSPPENSIVTDHGYSGTAYEDDACPLYAQPDKRKKSNDLTAVIAEEQNRYDSSLSHQPSDQPADAADDDGLMYADLDLTRAPETDSARMPPTDPDATVYADIKRAL